MEIPVQVSRAGCDAEQWEKGIHDFPNSLILVFMDVKVAFVLSNLTNGITNATSFGISCFWWFNREKMKKIIGLMFVIAIASQLAMARVVPEIDPSSAVSALALLGGGAMVLRAYLKSRITTAILPAIGSRAGVCFIPIFLPHLLSLRSGPLPPGFPVQSARRCVT